MSRARVRGFTLLELMIVVTIIAILAALAMYAYSGQARKSKRAEAKQVLADLILKQEKYRSNHPTYGTIADIGGAATSSHYTFTLTAASNTATAYEMKATPSGDQAKDTCGTLTVNMLNGTLSKSPSTSGCWN